MTNPHAVSACCDATVIWSNPENDIEGSWHCSDCEQRVEPCIGCGLEKLVSSMKKVRDVPVPDQHYTYSEYICPTCENEA